MQCEFCREEIEGAPFQNDGMMFCSLECSDSMETGEVRPMGVEVLDDPDAEEDTESVDDQSMDNDNGSSDGVRDEDEDI